ncbi:MAG: hypothetical protein ACOH10_12600 [Rhodoglobus sp.]
MTARDDAIARHPASTAWHDDPDAACIRWTADHKARLARVARIQAATRDLIADEAARQDPLRAPRGIVLAVSTVLMFAGLVLILATPRLSGGSIAGAALTLTSLAVVARLITLTRRNA